MHTAYGCSGALPTTPPVVRARLLPARLGPAALVANRPVTGRDLIGGSREPVLLPIGTARRIERSLKQAQRLTRRPTRPQSYRSFGTKRLHSHTGTILMPTILESSSNKPSSRGSRPSASSVVDELTPMNKGLADSVMHRPHLRAESAIVRHDLSTE